MKDERAAGPIHNDYHWREHLEDFVTNGRFSVEFFNAFAKFARAKARRYPAHLYSPITIWDNEGDAYRTIATDVLAHLIEKGLLAKLYYANRSNGEIHSYFTKAVRSYLLSIAKRRGKNTRSLLGQMRSALRESEKFQYFESVPGWGLPEWKGLEWDPIPADILAERIETTVVPERLWRSKGTSRKTRSRAEVEAFLRAYLLMLGRPVERTDLLRCAQVHFNVYDITQGLWPTERDEEGEGEQPVEFPDGSSLFGDQQHLPPNLANETRELIEKCLRELDEQNLQLLEDLWLNGREQKELVSPGNGKSNVSYRKQQILKRLQALGMAPEAIASFENLLREALLKRRAQIYVSSKDRSHTRRTAGDSGEATAIN